MTTEQAGRLRALIFGADGIEWDNLTELGRMLKASPPTDEEAEKIIDALVSKRVNSMQTRPMPKR